MTTYSSMIRWNHRYRGPIESYKINQFILQLYTDLDRARQQLNEWKTQIDQLDQVSSKGMDPYSSPGSEVRSLELTRTNDQVQSLKGGILYG